MNNKQRISDTKIAAMVRMKELGFKTNTIANLLHVSRVTVYCRTTPGAQERRLELTKVSIRNSVLTTGTTKANTIVLRQLNKRHHPGSCEMCGDKRLLHYHHWDNDNPELGLWVCVRCHKIAGVFENDPESLRLMMKYVRLKTELARDSKMLAVNDSHSLNSVKECIGV